MTVVHVVIACTAVILLLSAVPVGAWAEYSETGLLVRLKIGILSVQVFPVKAKNKAKATKGKKPKPQEAAGPKKGGTLSLVQEFLPLAAEAAGEVKQKISIDVFYMDLLWSVSDPAACAVGFGGANAAVGMIWPLIEQNFRVKDHRIRTAVDFDLGKPTVYLQACMTMRIGQLVSFGIRLAAKGYRVYQTYKTKEAIKQKEAV